MKKPSKSAVKNAKAKKAPASSQTATGRGKSAKTSGSVRQAAARKPAKQARAKKKVGTDLDRLGALPRSYGEERIFVVAQEPHWFFCYWDDALTEGVKGTIFLRHARTGADHPEAEVPVPAETNTWYLAVEEADAEYLVELGYYRGTRWQTLVRSGTVLTPRDSVAGFGQPVFANLPLQATRQPLGEIIRRARRGDESLNDTLARLEGRGEQPVDRLSPAQRTALERLLDTHTGLLTSGALAGSPRSSGAGLSSGPLWENSQGSWSSAALSSRGTITSGASSWAGGREFFLHLNAEVIFYGGTQPGAKVTVDGKEILIRPDGTFRYHFVLPDGEFAVPIVATSPDGAETRRGVLHFERATMREGEVGSTAQPPLGVPVGRQHP